MGKKMWFRMKHYGWGWVPISWEGWAVIGGMIAVIILTAHRLETGLMTLNTFYFWLVGSIVAVFIIGYAKGPKPRWRWGKN